MLLEEALLSKNEKEKEVEDKKQNCENFWPILLLTTLLFFTHSQKDNCVIL